MSPSWNPPHPSRGKTVMRRVERWGENQRLLVKSHSHRPSSFFSPQPSLSLLICQMGTLVIKELSAPPLAVTPRATFQSLTPPTIPFSIRSIAHSLTCPSLHLAIHLSTQLLGHLLPPTFPLFPFLQNHLLNTHSALRSSHIPPFSTHCLLPHGRSGATGSDGYGLWG